MNSHSNVAPAPPTIKNSHHHHLHRRCRRPIPAPALYVLFALFLVGSCVSTFFLIVIHNALFFVLVLSVSAAIAAFLLWNSKNAALYNFLHSFSQSDLSLAAHGQLVKITGVCLKLVHLLLCKLHILLVSCGNVSLESSYEKVFPCVYTSTSLYEYRDLCLKPSNVRDLCLLWRLVYSESLSADFYITDSKSGMRALVRAGPGSKVITLMSESRLIKTSKKCRVLSPDLRKWLIDRKISDEARSLNLQEGYIKDGSCASVVGALDRNGEVLMIVQPQEIVSTGCLWHKLLLPVDIEGLVIGIPQIDTNISLL